MFLPIIRASKFHPINYDVGGLLGGGVASKKGGDMLSGFGKAPGVTAVADPYGGLREPYINYMKDQIGKPGPTYTGNITAPMTSQETESLDKVNQYANQGSNSTINAGKAEIERTLNGSYDPSTSPYYQAVKAQSAANLADTNKTIASNAAGGGRYFTGSRMKQQARATNDAGMNLDTIMGTLAQNERQNRLNVLPQAMAYGEQEQNQPLQQATALQTLGALPRLLEQNTNNVNLENFYKSQYDYPLSILQMIAGVQSPPVYQANPDRIGQLMQLGGQVAGAAAMGCWVAASVFEKGWDDERTHQARNFINNIGPEWFKEFYLKHGENVAEYIQDKPLIKMALRPLFELFSVLGRTEMVGV